MCKASAAGAAVAGKCRRAVCCARSASKSQPNKLGTRVHKSAQQCPVDRIASLGPAFGEPIPTAPLRLLRAPSCWPRQCAPPQWRVCRAARPSRPPRLQQPVRGRCHWLRVASVWWRQLRQLRLTPSTPAGRSSTGCVQRTFSFLNLLALACHLELATWSWQRSRRSASPTLLLRFLLVQDLTAAGIPSLTPEEVSAAAEMGDAPGAGGLPMEKTLLCTCTGGPARPLDITCMRSRSQWLQRTKQCCPIVALFDAHRRLMRWSWGGRCSSMCGRRRTTRRWAAAEKCWQCWYSRLLNSVHCLTAGQDMGLLLNRRLFGMWQLSGGRAACQACQAAEGAALPSRQRGCACTFVSIAAGACRQRLHAATTCPDLALHSVPRAALHLLTAI